MSTSVWRRAAVVVVAGALLGAVDLLAQRTLPYPWANLANSSAVWAVGAFAIGRFVQRPWWHAALAGAAMLVIAVESYELTAVAVQHDDWVNLWAPATVAWLGAGVLAGAVFGTGAAWSRDAGGWRRPLGAALPVAVLLAEAGVDVYRSGHEDATYRTDSLWTAAITAALGIVAGWALGRDARGRLATFAISVPLALLGFFAFRLGGFGG